MNTRKAYACREILFPVENMVLAEQGRYRFQNKRSVESSVAEGIRQTDLTEKYDAKCKRILSEKPIIARIMKCCMPEYKDLDPDEISEKYIVGTPEVADVPVHPGDLSLSRIRGENLEDTILHEGTVTYDIRFQAVLPGTGERVRLLINIEAQNQFYPGYPIIKRGVFYGGRMLSSQYGTVFTNSDYKKLRKVYSIWICSKPPKSWQNTITSYHMTEENVVGEAHEKKENYDLLNVVMIGLTEADKADHETVVGMLSVLLSAEVSVEEKKRILENDFHIPMTQEITGGLEDMCNLSLGVLEKGWEKGIEEGRKEGRKEGTRYGRLESILEFLEDLQSVPSKLRTRILSENDETTIKAWLKAAARAETLEEFCKNTGLEM